MPLCAGVHRSKLHLRVLLQGLLRKSILIKRSLRWGEAGPPDHPLNWVWEESENWKQGRMQRTIRNWLLLKSLTKYSPSSLTCFGLKCCLVLLLLVSLLDQLDATYLMHSSFQKPTTPEKICSNVAAGNKNPLVIYYCCSTKWLHFCLFSCTLLLSTTFSAGALVQLKHTAPFAELHLGKESQVGPGSCQQGTAEVVTAPLACLSSTETLPTTALPTRAAARKSRIARCHNKLLACRLNNIRTNGIFLTNYQW